jgi:biopolymer transport protein ExbB
MLRGLILVTAFVLAVVAVSPGAAVFAQAPSAPPADTPNATPSPASPPADASATAPAPAAPAIVANAHLPRDLSPWSMFEAADWLVKAVMISLAFASVVTWTVWLAKTLELMFAGRRLARDLAAISDERSLGDAEARLPRERGVLAALVSAAGHELRLSSDVTDKDGIKERVASRLTRIEVAAGRRINRGTGVLATIGSTAPFVGLFGTVWGIMNSFIGISKAQTTNLAVVAPGIAEALLATAIGLVAAIPAVIIYNHFSRQIAGYKALVADAAAEVLRLVSRDLDRAQQPRKISRAAE